MLAFAQSGKASEQSKLNYYYTLYCQADGRLAPPFEPIGNFVDKMDAKRNSFKTEKAFVHYLFVKSNQHFLKRFNANASFADLINHGSYNCLSGTALYALILQHFQIDFKIVETNYHIFILAETDGGEVLLESTDATNGFVDEPRTIRERITRYNDGQVEKTNASKYYFQYSSSKPATVSLPGMLGLLHYNQAVQAFNDQQFNRAITHIHHAFLLHRSPKMEDFVQLMITTLIHSGAVDQNTTEQYLVKLRNLQGRKGSKYTTLMVPLIR